MRLKNGPTMYLTMITWIIFELITPCLSKPSFQTNETVSEKNKGILMVTKELPSWNDEIADADYPYDHTILVVNRTFTELRTTTTSPTFPTDMVEDNENENENEDEDEDDLESKEDDLDNETETSTTNSQTDTTPSKTYNYPKEPTSDIPKSSSESTEPNRINNIAETFLNETVEPTLATDNDTDTEPITTKHYSTTTTEKINFKSLANSECVTRANILTLLVSISQFNSIFYISLFYN